MARLLRMPEVAANAVEAVLSEWPVPENTPFTAQDPIATVETEKAVVDVPADANGVILKTLVTAGTVVEVGTPIALLGDPGELVEDLGALLAELGVAPDPVTASSVMPPANAPEGVAVKGDSVANGSGVADGAGATNGAGVAHGDSAANGAGVANGDGVRIFSSPLARRLAREAGLEIANLTGTGPGGRIVRRDVEQATGALAAEPQVSPPLDPGAVVPRASVTVEQTEVAAYEDIPHTRMRRAIAARLTESTREAPHFYLRGTARVDRLLRLRERLNDSGTVSSVKISVNDLVVTAAARAHVLVPAMNVIWTADAVRSFSAVDISVAVATDGGLVTPVLRGVDRMTLSAVAAASSDLVRRARSGQLRQDELDGGTLTVTNLGGHGTEEFAAIINPPQSAILAVGAALEAPVVRRGKLRVGNVMRVTLSIDHRPIDGVVAARWMAAFLALLESPVRILA
jgi:pyruvate dehydrogenase E2 component (dihydrolipoamide acetyltransferase)